MANIYTDIKLFDAEYYLANNPDVAAAIEGTDITAQDHYFLHGAAENLNGGAENGSRAPNSWFNAAEYVAQNPDLAGVDANLLLAHFALHGVNEGRAPNAATAGADGKIKPELLADYVNAEGNEDVKAAIAEMTGTAVGAELTAEQAAIAIQHFFNYGINEEDRKGGIADVIAGEDEGEGSEGEGEGLTEALAKLAAAQVDSANALKAMNEALGETDDEGEVTPATFANAEEAEAALTEKVTEAEEKRDAELAKTVGKQTDGSPLKSGLVKSLGTNATLTEANLTTARDAVQAEIDSSTAMFSNDGALIAVDPSNDNFKLGDAANQVLDLSGIETVKNIKVNFATVNSDNNKDDAAGGGKDTVILPNFSADYTGTLTLEGMILGQNPEKGFDTLVAPNLASQFTKVVFSTDDDKAGNGYLTVTLTNAAGGELVLKDLIKGETFAAKFYNDGENVEFDKTGLENFISALNGLFVNGNSVFAWSEAAAAADSTDGSFPLTVNPSSVSEFVGQLVAYGNLKTSANTSGLEQVGFTLADLQDAAADAAEALETARDVEADAGLLEGVVAGINGYMGAGGIDVNIDQNHTLLSLRGEINAALAANADITLEEFLESSETKLGLDDIEALASGHVSELVLRALASGNTKDQAPELGVNENGVVTTTAAKAPTTGEGTWAKGAAAEEDGKFVFTYTPSAAEQALVDSINALGERAELIDAESDTAKALKAAGKALGETDTDAGDLIAQLDAINGQLDVLADAEQAVVDAQDALSDAQPSIDALKAAEEAQAEAEQWFEDNGYELPIDLDGTVKATAENDIFLFNAEAESATVTDFGKQGEDSIFFGEGFTLTQITGDIADGGHGDVNALEILWKQVGNNVELYVEEFEFAGTGSGTADLTKVTLVGVNGSDLQDNLDNGLLSLGDLVA